MSTGFLVRARDPQGNESFICHEAPGLTPDRAKALRFTNETAANRAAY